MSPSPEAAEAAPFEYDWHVRYSEVDHRGLMTPAAVVNAFQDCSTFQSERLGVGMGWLREQGRAWVLTHWHIVIARYPGLCERIRVGTFAGRFRGVTASRYFYLRDDAGGLVARGASSWAFLDLATGRPCRIEPRFAEPYGTHAPLEMPAERRHVAVPDGLEPRDEVVIRRGQIDTNEHVNNAEYVQMALEQLDRDLSPAVLRVDYRRAAVLGDVVAPAVGHGEDGRTVVVLGNARNADEPFAVVELG